MAQSIAWYTGAALTGGVVEVGDSFEELTAPGNRCPAQVIAGSRPAGASY